MKIAVMSSQLSITLLKAAGNDGGYDESPDQEEREVISMLPWRKSGMFQAGSKDQVTNYRHCNHHICKDQVFTMIKYHHCHDHSISGLKMRDNRDEDHRPNNPIDNHHQHKL